MTSAPITGAARDLAASGIAVREGARASLTSITLETAQHLKRARAPYPYRYVERIAATARAMTPRESKTANRLTASVKVGGARPIVSGGASASRLVWGAEYGAKGGDAVRVTLSTGRTQTVRASSFAAYRARAEAQHTAVTARGKRRAVTSTTAGATRTRVVGVRKGGLPQFPPRRRDGWFLTPALDAREHAGWRSTGEAFDAALAQGVPGGR